MNHWTDEQIRNALKTAFFTATKSEPRRDLWPRILHRMDAPASRISWLEWAFVAVAALCVLLLPGAAPLLFYFL